MFIFIFNKSAFYKFIFKFKVFFMLKSIINNLKRLNMIYVKCLIIFFLKKTILILILKA